MVHEDPKGIIRKVKDGKLFIEIINDEPVVEDLKPKKKVISKKKK